MVVAPIITVFGATGFLGQRIVRHLHERGCAVRIASRHPARGRALFGADDPRLRPSKVIFNPANQWPMRSPARMPW
jgi:uncharacterized protein YbjT (DUF2867 family)